MTAGFVDATRLRPSTLAPPLSKSDAQRCLALAHALDDASIANAVHHARREALAEDIHVLDRALATLRRGIFPGDIDCKDGGAPFRIALTQAAVTPSAVISFHGSARLGARPHDALVASLERSLGPHGLTIVRGTPWPMRVSSPTRTGAPTFSISGAESSQYASSLLLGAATLSARERRPWSVAIQGEMASPGYLDMTLAWLGRAGFDVTRAEGVLSVSKGASPAIAPAVPGDWSSLGYLLVLAWKTRSSVSGVDPTARHPDAIIASLLEEIGLSVEVHDHVATVRGEATHGLVASAKRCPDAIPTLAALACVLPAPSRFDDVGILRHKESDRLSGTEGLVSAVGGTTHRDGDSLIVVPPKSPARHFHLDTHADHRMAMAATTLAALVEGTVELSDVACVKKSFPDFFAQVANVGITLVAGTPSA